jgi:hypothetical protein
MKGLKPAIQQHLLLQVPRPQHLAALILAAERVDHILRPLSQQRVYI